MTTIFVIQKCVNTGNEVCMFEIMSHVLVNFTTKYRCIYIYIIHISELHYLNYIKLNTKLVYIVQYACTGAIGKRQANHMHFVSLL